MITRNELFELSHKTIHLDIRVPHKPTLNELLNSICRGSDWKRDDYNLIIHNYQDFVCKLIEKLNAVRPRLKYGCCFPNSSVSQFPYCIVKQLKKNDDPSQIVDKIPLIGPIEETFRLFVLYSLF